MKLRRTFNTHLVWSYLLIVGIIVLLHSAQRGVAQKATAALVFVGLRLLPMTTL